MCRALAFVLSALLVAGAPVRVWAAAGSGEAKAFVERPLLRPKGELPPSEAIEAIKAARRPVSPAEEVNLLADKIDHFKERNLVIATGGVEVTYQTTTLKAERVEFNTKTGDAVATGDVVISSEGSLIKCQRAIFNIYTQRGFMYDAEGFASPVYYFTGKRIEKIGDDKIRIYQGTLTSCGPACGPGPRAWAFRVGKAELQLDRYAHIFGFVPKVMGLPFFYLPYYLASIKTDRATGFLPPVVGSDSEDGIIVTNQFFWAISPSMDATFGIDYLSNRGTRYTGEFRYVLDERSMGQLNASYLKDGEFFNQSISRQTWLFNDDRGPDDLPLGGEFYKLTLDHKQVLPGELELVGRMDLQSDNTNFDREFSDDLILRTKRETETFVSLTKNWERRSFQILGEWIASLEDNLFSTRGGRMVRVDDEEVFGRLPSIQFLQQPEQIGSTPVYFSLDSSWTNFFEEDEEERPLDSRLERLRDVETTPRFDIYPTLSVPWALAPWLSVTPSVSFRETYWWKRRPSPLASHNISDGLSRELFEGKVSIRGPTFYRIYHLKTPWATKYKHLIEPGFSYRYVTDFDEEDSLQVPRTISGGFFDGIDSFDRGGLTGTVGVNEFTYGLTNRILAKTAAGKVEEILRFSVDQLFDIKEYRKDERTDVISLGPIEFDLESRLVPPFILNSRASYDYAHKRLASLSTTVGLEAGRLGAIYTDYTFSQVGATGENTQSFYTGAAGVNLTDSLHAQYRIRYDEKEGAVLENQYILVYRGCCWSIQLTLFDRIDETKLMVMLDLKGIGSTGRTFRVGSDLGGKRRRTRQDLPISVQQSLSGLSPNF